MENTYAHYCHCSGILDKECLPEPSTVAEGVECWEWWVENKYYTATVQLANIVQPDQCLPWIMEHGEACLIYCDATQVSTLPWLRAIALPACSCIIFYYCFITTIVYFFTVMRNFNNKKLLKKVCQTLRKIFTVFP